jgi:hypothetical protein
VVTRSKAEFTEAIAPSPKTPAEFEHRLRSLSLTDALIVVTWLNSAKGSARARVLRIRDDLAQLSTMLDSLHQQVLTRRAQRKLMWTPPCAGDVKLHSAADIKQALEDTELRLQFQQRHSKLNQALRRYSFHPVVLYDAAAGSCRYNSIPNKQSGPQLEITHQGMIVQINEAAAAAALARLAANGQLHKVRRCEQCKKKWRVSEREIDRFCPGKECREKWYRSQPEFTERRKKIQKEWRDRENLKRAKALAQARKGRK